MRIGQARREQIRIIYMYPQIDAGTSVVNALALAQSCHRLEVLFCIKPTRKLTLWELVAPGLRALLEAGFQHILPNELLEKSCFLQRPRFAQEVVAPEEVDLFRYKRERVKRTELELLLGVKVGRGYYCSRGDKHLLLRR